MDKKKLGFAAASLLGAATMFTASPAHADIVIICDTTCPEPIKPGADPFIKLTDAYSKIQVRLADSDAWSKIDAAFSKLFVKFG